MTLFSAHVYGKAVPQGSKRLSSHGHMYESGKGLKEWRAAIAWTVAAAMKRANVTKTSEPVSLTLRFHVKIPKSRSKALGEGDPHVGTPDVDKLARAALDALTGVLYEDDAQVYRLTAQKEYSIEPGLDVQAIIG